MKHSNIKTFIFAGIYFIGMLAFIVNLWVNQNKQEKQLDDISTRCEQVKTQYEQTKTEYDDLLVEYQVLTEAYDELYLKYIESINTEEPEVIIPPVANINPIEVPETEEKEETETVITEPIVSKPTVPTYTYSYGQHINYVAFGNSITIHGINEYWWNNIGMGATTIDKDYVHQVLAGLQALTGSASLTCYNYCNWELQVNDRAETYCLIDYYLDTQPDIISLQMSENIVDMSHYESDWEELIRYIQKKCPNAQILVIDDFWYGGDKSNLKKQAAENCGVQFISLSAIRGKSEYQCGMGTTVYDAEGNPHTVDHEGVAAHPGDLGMAYIANQILQHIH